MLAHLTAAEELTDNIGRFYFYPERKLDQIAGQFAEFTLAHGNADAKGMMRQFTLSNSPDEATLAITVRRSSSPFKQALWAMRPGDSIHVSEPLGDFVLPLSTATPLAWIAGGIGITPFRSMAAWLAGQHERRAISLFHSVSRPQEAIFGADFEAAGITERLVIDTSAANQLHLDANTILGSMSPAGNALFYISGPELFVDSLSGQLTDAGIAASRIVTDAFLGYR